MKSIHKLIVLGASLLLSACSFSLAEDITAPPGSQMEPPTQTQPPTVRGPLYPLVAPDPQDGAAIYLDKCAPCHGESGQGNGPQADQLPNPATPIGSAEIARNSTPAGWYDIVTRGNLDRFMPPFQSLSERQRWDVIAYVYTLSSSINSIELGYEIYQQNCADCHGGDGKGNGPQAAGLTRPLPNFTDQAYMSQKSAANFFTAVSSGVEPEMPGFQDLLTEEERWALTDYLRTLTFADPGQQTLLPGGLAPEVSPETQPEPADAIGTTDIEEGVGRITGKVISGSGSQLPAGLEVTLHGFDGMQVVMTDTVKTDAEGSFLFEHVDMPDERVFLATTELGNATYASNVATVKSGEETLSLSITAYDTTTDQTSLAAERLHVFLDYSIPDVLQVIELYIMSNLGDKTIVPLQEGDPVVTFSLPQGAENLQFQDGELGGRYLQTADGFGDTLAVRPSVGEYQVLFAYELPYKNKLVLEHPINMPVNAVVIMQTEGGVRVRSEQLQDEGPKDIQGTTYQIYSGGPLPAGSTLSVSLSGNPRVVRSGLASAASNDSLIIGLGAFGLVMVISGIWLYRRHQANEGLIDDEETDLEEPIEEYDREGLMDAIIALDDLYQAGELPEEAYRLRRAELKTRLKELDV